MITLNINYNEGELKETISLNKDNWPKDGKITNEYLCKLINIKKSSSYFYSLIVDVNKIFSVTLYDYQENFLDVYLFDYDGTLDADLDISIKELGWRK